MLPSKNWTVLNGGRSRSDRVLSPNFGGSALCGIVGECGMGQESAVVVASMLSGEATALQVVLILPGELASMLPTKPKSLKHPMT